jgi:hypothetical protein
MDTRQEMGDKNYDRFVNLFEMWKRLNWLYKGKSLGCGVKFVYSDDNYSLYQRCKTKVTHKLSKFVDYTTFQGLVNKEMKKLNDLRNEYLELQSLYNDAKYYHTTYDTIDVVTDSGESTLVCAHCHSDEIFVISPHRHLDHLGITEDDISKEFPWEPDNLGNGLYSNEDYDYSSDEILNKEIKREYRDHRCYNNMLTIDKLEAKFYTIAGSMTIGQVYKKLGRDAVLIADLISEYYSVKKNR